MSELTGLLGVVLGASIWVILYGIWVLVCSPLYWKLVNTDWAIERRARKEEARAK